MSAVSGTLTPAISPLPGASRVMEDFAGATVPSLSLSVSFIGTSSALRHLFQKADQGRRRDLLSNLSHGGRCKMKVVVVGGSGRVGSRLVTMLTRDGHEVVAASRRSGVDAVTGEGLAEALRSAEVVVDASNSPSFEDAAVMKFFKTSTKNILAVEAAAGVRHHVAVSVVGTGRLPGSGYLRAKLAQEKLIEA